MLRKSTRRQIPAPLEKDLQRQCVRLLKMLGWAEPKDFIHGRSRGILLIYGTHRRADDYQGTMQSAGAPDLWIEGVGYVELKRERGGRVTKEQQLLVDRGLSRIVRAVEEMQELLKGNVCQKKASNSDVALKR